MTTQAPVAETGACRFYGPEAYNLSRQVGRNFILLIAV
jgi:hypothetical protein